MAEDTMAIVTSTVTINAAFLQEIKEDNRNLKSLLGELRRLIANAEQRLERRRHLSDLLGRFRDQLAIHFSLEEAFGYFDEPVSVAPQLCARADCLRAEHGELYQRICDIAESAESFACCRVSVPTMAQFAARFIEFDETLKRHEDNENSLILEAFDEDIGVGD